MTENPPLELCVHEAVPPSNPGFARRLPAAAEPTSQLDRKIAAARMQAMGAMVRSPWARKPSAREADSSRFFASIGRGIRRHLGIRDAWRCQRLQALGIKRLTSLSLAFQCVSQPSSAAA